MDACGLVMREPKRPENPAHEAGFGLVVPTRPTGFEPVTSGFVDQGADRTKPLPKGLTVLSGNVVRCALRCSPLHGGQLQALVSVPRGRASRAPVALRTGNAQG